MDLNPVALATFRQKEGLSQAALSRSSGVSQGHISDLESGNRTSISPDTAKRLAEALGIPVSAFAFVRVRPEAVEAVEAAS